LNSIDIEIRLLGFDLQIFVYEEYLGVIVIEYDLESDI